MRGSLESTEDHRYPVWVMILVPLLALSLQTRLPLYWGRAATVDLPLLVTVYFASNRLFRSDDRGNSWKIISPELSRGLDRNKLPVMGKIWGADAVAKHMSTSFFGNATVISESPKKEGVIYVGTFSKLMFPALRLGYLVLPESLVRPVGAAKAILPGLRDADRLAEILLEPAGKHLPALRPPRVDADLLEVEEMIEQPDVPVRRPARADVAKHTRP